MAGTSDESLVNLLPAVGIANLGPETSATPQTLREAVNVDLTKEGKIRRRGGRTRIVAGTRVHSAWAKDGQFPYALYADNDTLMALWPDGNVTPVTNGLAIGVPVSYDLINGNVYWSNGVQSGLITPELEALPWGPEPPAGQPDLEAITDGGLDAGRYQVAVTFRDLLGRESGTGVAALVEVAAGGGIRLTNIPQPVSSAITTVRIYRTGANDTSLRHVMDLPAGLPTVVIGVRERGKALETQHHAAMPAGHIVRYGHGRQWIARNKELLWSPSMRYGLWAPARARLGFSDRIAMAEPIGDGGEGAGCFVAAGNRTYWLSGANPDGFTQRIAYPAGVVPGSSVVMRGSAWGLETGENVVAWLATNGIFCVGTPGGLVVRMKEAEAVATVGERGASLFRETNGIRQFLTSLQGPTNAPGLRMGDRVAVRTLRHDE